MTDADRPQLEAYVETLDQARAAAAAGATRLELCDPGEGGLTPSTDVTRAVLAAVTIPVHVMIRPRAGDFVYSAAEFAEMRRSVKDALDAGVAGVVFGILHADGRLDIERMASLVESARPLRVICHRAFDSTPDADDALDSLIALGAHGVLTSGHAPTALEGALTLARHVQTAASYSRPFEIIAGGSVRAANVRPLIEASGLSSVHARATDAAVFAALASALR